MRILHDREGNLRVVWRMIVYVFLGAVMFLPLIPVLKILPFPKGETSVASVANVVFVLFLNISFLSAAWIALKYVDRRPAALLGLNFWPESLREFVVGIGIGVLNFGAVVAVLLALGCLTVQWNGESLIDANTAVRYLATFFVFSWLIFALSSFVFLLLP